MTSNEDYMSRILLIFRHRTLRSNLYFRMIRKSRIFFHKNVFHRHMFSDTAFGFRIDSSDSVIDQSGRNFLYFYDFNCSK